MAVSAGHEQVTFCQDMQSGLRAIIAIYSTALGPALTQPGTPSFDPSTAPKFDLTLRMPVVLPHPAFVGMTFATFNNCVTPAGDSQTDLVIADSVLCEPCKNFNYYYDPAGIARAEYCYQAQAGHSVHFGPPILSVTGTCGQYVPTLPATWGQLKLRYAAQRPDDVDAPGFAFREHANYIIPGTPIIEPDIDDMAAGPFRKGT